MIKLSCVIIAFNEERDIGRCLESVKMVADEVVVVDSCSTDKTIEICKSYGAKVIVHPFEGYIEQKNYALKHASNQYVLSLDADEALSDALINSIRTVKENWKCDGYYMNRLNNYCGKWIYHSGWYPDKKLRLFNSKKGKWNGMNPHDKYEMYDGDKVTGFLNGDILHFSYYSIKDHIIQADHFTNISSKVLFSNNIKPDFIKRFLSPVAKFLGDYFFKMGFLDGYYGFVICTISAKATFNKYKKLKMLYDSKKKN